MAITTSQWSHVLTIPESYTPSAATSGQTLVITESVIAKLSAGDQTTFWSNVQNGGGDVRICTDSGGVNQLPVEVVSLDNSAQTCVIWTRKPSYNGTGDLYLFIGKAGETQPLVTDPFGRNAVWQDFEYCFHFEQGGELVDSSGNYSLTEGGDVLNIVGKVGRGADAQNDSANFYQISAYTGPTGGAPRTHSMWINPSATSGLVEYGTNSTGQRYTVRMDSGRFRTEIAGSFTRTTNTNFADGAWHRAVTKEDGSGVFPSGNTLSVDGAVQAVNTGSNISLNTTPNGNVFFENDIALNSPNGKFDEYALRLFETSDAVDETEYANQNDPATFFGTPTLAATGGGGGGLTLIPTLIPSGEVVGTPSVTNLLQLVEANAIPTQEAVQNPAIDTGAILISPATIPTGEVVYNVSVVDLTQFIVAEDIPTQEVVGSPSLELLLSRIFPTAIATQENFETPLIIGGDRIAIPINDRATWNRVAAYLRTRKFSGNDNDVILAWLRSEGYIDTFNDAFNTYLEDVEALDGSLTDKYSNWRRQ